MAPVDVNLETQARITEAIVKALFHAPVVAIHGPIGAGKSTIAGLVLDAWQAAYPRAHLVHLPLAKASGPGELGLVVSAAFDLLEGGGLAEMVEQVAVRLRSCPGALVCLDDVDTCLEPALVLLKALSTLPEVHVLVTSRVQLKLPEVVVHHVPPLEVREARAFLLAQVNPQGGGEGEQQDRTQLEELLRLVETTPQVLTLMAPHLRYTPPAALGANLPRILGLLDPGGGDGQGFGAALHQIVAKVTERERRVLELCSVFRGGPSVDTILSLDDSLDLVSLVATLERLREGALLTTVRHPHEITIHVYPTLKLCVMGQLSLARRQELWALHRDHFIAYLRQARGRHASTSLGVAQWTKRWLPDLQQAFDHRDISQPAGLVEALQTLDPHLTHLLDPARHLALIETLLEEIPALALRLPLWCIKARLCREALDQEQASEALRQAGQALGPDVPPHDHAAVLLARVQLAHTQGDQDRCLELTHELLGLVDPQEQPGIHLEAQVYRAFLTFSTDDIFQEQMLPLLDRARAIEHVYAELSTRHNLANSMMRQNHDGEARHHYDSILDLAETIGSDQYQSIALLGLRNIETRQDHIEAALELMLKAMAVAKRSGNQRHLQNFSNYYGLLLISVGDYTLAHHMLEQTQSFLRRHPNDHAQVFNVVTLAILSHVQGDFHLAYERYHEALRLSAAQGWHYWHKAQGQFYLALCLMQDDQPEAALEALGEGAEQGGPSSFLPLCRMLQSALLHPEIPLQSEIPSHPPILHHAGRLIEAIRLRTPDVPPPLPPCWFCLRLLWQVWQGVVSDDQIATFRAKKDAPQRLEIHPAGRFFVLPQGERVDMTRRGPMRKLLVALGEQHGQALGAPLSLDALFAIGWPQQQHVDLSSAHKRVYAAIATLRQLGLKPWLITTDQGYQLDPQLCVMLGKG